MQPQHRFRVPTLDGTYIEASGAIFSAGWPTETASELFQAFLDAAPSGLTDLEQLKNRRLAAPDHPLFRGLWIEDWVQFLTELGVSAGLKPELRAAKNKNFDAHRISDFSFLQDYGIPPGFAELWRDDIAAQDGELVHFPSRTTYVINGELPWFPGQPDVETFSSTCTALYATLIFGWLSAASDFPNDIDVHHHFSAKGGSAARIAGRRGAGVPSAGGATGFLLPSSEARSRASAAPSYARPGPVCVRTPHVLDVLASPRCRPVTGRGRRDAAR